MPLWEQKLLFEQKHSGIIETESLQSPNYGSRNFYTEIMKAKSHVSTFSAEQKNFYCSRNFSKAFTPEWWEQKLTLVPTEEFWQHKWSPQFFFFNQENKTLLRWGLRKQNSSCEFYNVINEAETFPSELWEQKSYRGFYRAIHKAETLILGLWEPKFYSGI